MGTWDYTASQGAIGTLTFDASGNWTGDATEANSCSPSPMNGTYTFQGGTLELVTIHDSSPCNPDWEMTFVVTFNSACTTAQLQTHIDNCTGGHMELDSDPILTKN